ncbi:MAG: hypothetical protein JXO49_11835 [Deltaproteobacteria bacterium]|nr:hypothetical protein [Candidatus Anaeroferrophillus wilburensis]MBN2890023.1 hypothetical protein [Deltaproteobacteria bacterium]
MTGKRYKYVLGLLLLVGVLICSACMGMDNDLKFNLEFDQLQGLSEGDRVYFKEYPVGTIGMIRVHEDGMFLVQVRIQDAQRAVASRNNVFVLDNDPVVVGKKAIMIKKGRKASLVPIRDNETIAGCTSLAYYLQRNRETLEETSEVMSKTFEEFLNDLKDVPQSVEYRDLQRSLRETLEQLLQEGEHYKEKVQQEILPELQRRIEELKQQFQLSTEEPLPEKPTPPVEREKL